jgi:hypothetical protein
VALSPDWPDSDSDFQWTPPINVQEVEESPNGRECTFLPKDDKAIAWTVDGRDRDSGTNLGQAKATLTAKGFKITASTKAMEPKPQIWKSGIGLVVVNSEIAVDQPVMLSAIINPAPQGVDGNTETMFHTDIERNPWWQVDLQKSYNLGAIMLRNRRGGWLDRAASVQVLLSQDGNAWQTIYSHNGKDFEDLRVDAGGRTARYVRIQLAQQNYLHLSEVEVYGSGSMAEAQTAIKVIAEAIGTSGGTTSATQTNDVDGVYTGAISGGEASGKIQFTIKGSSIQGSVKGDWGTENDSYLATFSGAFDVKTASFRVSLTGTIEGLSFSGQISGQVKEGKASGVWEAKNEYGNPTGAWTAKK